MPAIQLQGISLDVLVEHKRIKNIYMRMKNSKQIQISAHPSVPYNQIEAFIVSKQEWILKARLRWLKQQAVEQYKGIENDSIQFLGKTMPLKLQIGSYPTLVIENDYVVLQVQKNDPETVQKTFNDQAKRILERYCLQMRERYDRIMDDYHLPHPVIHFRKMTSKWGSCIPSKAKITMNINLIFMPIECFDYVLLHEFVHMIVPNHSKRFYDLVQYHMPQYKKYRTMLKEK